MAPRRRRIGLPAAVATAGVLLLAVAGGPTSAAPHAAEAALARLESATGDGIVNDEVAVATLDPTGLPERALLLSRVTATGPAREVIDPASLTNVRYLDRLGRPEVTSDGVLLTVGGERPSALTQARFDKPLPVALHAEYALDGRTVPAEQVPGASGEVAVTYTLTNTTARQTELTYTDAAGAEHTTTEPVFAPFQGTLTATLPGGAALVDDGGAMLATDEQGRTVVRWNVSLFPPISAPIQRIGFTMRADRAGIPAVEVELTPAALDQDPAADFSSELLTGATAGNEELYGGLSELDRGATSLASGADQLSQGLAGLATGAGQAADASGTLAGGVDDVAGGARRVARATDGLAGGLGDLASGADELAGGSAQLAGALGQAVSGADELAAATARLAAAADTTGPDPVAPLIAGGEQIEAGLAEAVAGVGSPDDPVLSLTTPLPPDGDDVCPAGGVAPPDDDCVTLYQGVRLLRDGLKALTAVADAITARGDQARAALDQLLADLGSIRDDVTDAATGAADLYASLCQGPSPSLDPASCAQLADVVASAASALQTGAGARPTVEDLVAAVSALERQATAITAILDYALASTEELLAGVEQLGIALGQGTPGQPGLSAAMAQLNEGLRQLSSALATSRAGLSDSLAQVATGSASLAIGLAASATGADQLADGSTGLAAGAEAAAGGATDLAQGAAALAAGAGDASVGADQLAQGVDQLAGGTASAAGAGADVASGAQALQQDGIAPAADAVLDASTDPALAEAWLAAASARAADALPYGPPEGGVGNVAYVLTMAEVPAPRSLWQRLLDMVR